MTAVEWLEVKLDNIGLNSDIIGDYIQQAKEMEKQQQDEFAIGFAEWAYRNDYNIGFYFKQDTTKELLEIYKKQL